MGAQCSSPESKTRSTQRLGEVQPMSKTFLRIPVEVRETVICICSLYSPDESTFHGIFGQVDSHFIKCESWCLLLPPPHLILIFDASWGGGVRLSSLESSCVQTCWKMAKTMGSKGLSRTTAMLTQRSGNEKSHECSNILYSDHWLWQFMACGSRA